MGGISNEREISLQSGSMIASALRETGTEVVSFDIAPDRLEILDDKTIMLTNDRTGTLEVAVDEIEVLLGRHGFRNCREIPQIGKHNGHFFADMIPQLNIDDALPVQKVEVFQRDEPTEGLCRFAQLQVIPKACQQLVL